ncbi:MULTISPECIES: thiolase family protein [Acidiplasma]|jgi:acetyl-CoA acetyltransferase|uniref:Acetyl-CoA acetyltransferase n=2 Tax=Acidiplasma TaxID=507753 RepID=A0A0Q1B834_9ARCH|nr:MULTISPECIES: thiolase family protein [Acidiplasma]KQB33678.1 acetyl-CoA acetyltransferase [Acidiplasma aeolicum]KQB36401.1 acetyl-CoA acetyltransferase [Acidiplasma cupricumulans]
MIKGFAEAVYKKYDGTAYDLMNEALEKALNMAGIQRSDIQGFITTFLPGIFDGNIFLHFFPDQLCGYLGINPKYIDSLDYGGPSVLAGLYRAEKLIKYEGLDNILLLFGGKGSLVRQTRETVDSYENLYDGVTNTPYKQLLSGYSYKNPLSDYALVAQRHKKIYGTADEDRARLMVKQRKNGNDSGYSMFTGDISVDDVLSSPVISSPLHLLEIVYPVDGFHAFIVSKSPGKLRPVKIKKYGEAHWSKLPPELEEIMITPASESSRNFRDEIKHCDAYELYDSFSITVILQLEDTGIIKKGEFGKFIEKTDISSSGDMPLNTGGGSINRGQPAYMSGSVLLYESLLQLNGMAKNQVRDINSVFINGIGGWSRNHSVSMILGD